MPNNQQTALSKIVSGGLRSIAASFPGFASLGQVWNEYENHQTGQRIEELMENLKIKLAGLNARINNVEEICQQVREEFPSLLEITIDKVRKEFSREKRKIYADMLANLLCQQYQEPYDNKIAVLHSVDALNPEDLEVLKLFRPRGESAAKNLNWQNLNLPGDNNKKLAELMSMLAKLESRGLIITIGIYNGVVHVPNGLDKSIARLSERQYRILPLGQKILLTLE
ncbi:MAG: hypothetical protein K8R02_06330 [Anaerohalosphaeraceae bacterium]|nr:hypothetical protein [Anaerohalosphaeraceae bacterium]